MQDGKGGIERRRYIVWSVHADGKERLNNNEI